MKIKRAKLILVKVLGTTLIRMFSKLIGKPEWTCFKDKLLLRLSSFLQSIYNLTST